MTPRAATTPGAARRALARRGLTFLECVAATALLGLAAASAFSVLEFVAGNQARQQQKLAAAELANRLVLMYLDDGLGMPDPGSLLEYGPHKYRWEFAEQPVVLTEARPEGRDQGRPSTLPIDRFSQVTVRVWLSEKSGGARDGSGSAPSATQSRIFDPYYFSRNPDSMKNLIADPSRMQRYLERIMGFHGAGESGRGAPAGPRGGPRSPGRR
ncbi:MAG: hypothetical protein ACKVU4_14785 [Phycisphaerales bacterium]